MTMQLDHTIVPSRDGRAAAELLATILGVPWAESGVGPFCPVYVNDGLTLDFDHTDGPFPVQHYSFRVSEVEFDGIVARLMGAGIKYRSTPHGPVDMQINTHHGGRIVYWNEPDGHVWEALTLSYARRPRAEARGHEGSAEAPIDYLNPRLPAGLRRVRIPVVNATPEALLPYGRLIADPKECPIEIVRWPAQGTRPVDPETGDQGGTTEGMFVSEWQGDILYGRNEAVGGHYVLAYAQPPESARLDHADPPSRIILWHANYHPDGGQLFFPLDAQPFYAPLALPGDDVTPERFVCFRFDGRRGLYIHPNIWHEGVFGLSGTQRFFDKQGAVHARVSVDFAREFGCLLEASL